MTVSLSKGHKQSDVKMPPKNSRKGVENAQTAHVVTLSKTDLSQEKKHRTNNSKKHMTCFSETSF
jgi:hypothetical protein